MARNGCGCREYGGEISSMSFGEEISCCGPTACLAMAHTFIADDHIGFMDKYGVNYLIDVDIHSKWLDVVTMTYATAGISLMFREFCISLMVFRMRLYPTMDHSSPRMISR